jgi:hypothetical protein
MKFESTEAKFSFEIKTGLTLPIFFSPKLIEELKERQQVGYQSCKNNAQRRF